MLLEIGGGFLGLVLLAESLVDRGITHVSAIPGVASAGFFLLGIIAGLALVENPALGLRLSLVYQALQIPMFVSPFVTYILTSGFTASVHIQVANRDVTIGANCNFGSQFQFHFSKDMPWFFGINIVAVALLFAVTNAMKGQSEPEDGQLSPEDALNSSPDDMSS